jgi:hypothetical protein
MSFLTSWKRPILGISLAIAVAGCQAESEVTITQPISSFTASSAHAASSISSLPRSVHITVPFASQAPFANWAEPYQEACEEASLILVHHYLIGEPIDPAAMDRSILDLVAWESEHGYPQDVNAEDLAEIARAYYGHEAQVIADVTVDGVKEILARGVPVILPLAGRDLGNPYYSGEGPWYHMLVVTGFDDDEFITNDVGTKRGKEYRYRHNTLLNAVHDWTGIKEEIRSGKKAMLIVR